MSEEYWKNHRHEPLSLHEKRIYTIMDSIKHIRDFRIAMDAAVLLSSGFIGSRNYVEFGPANTFYSYNPIEGSRVRFGGRTTRRFSKKINFDTYAAYGVNDNKYKYFFGTSYSFTSQSIFDFPVKSLKISYQNDIKILGQDLQFAQDNNVLFSFKRGTNDKMYYNRTLKIEQLNEFQNHFSYLLGYEYTHQIPTGNLFFDPTKYFLSSSNKPYLNISQVNLNLRYAPNERFFQGKIYRVPIVNQYPVFQVQYSIGSKIIGNEYNYNKIILNISKRFYLSLVGFTDLTIESGKIFGKVSYPLLDIHPANQTYSYQSLSYNLMNFLEFVSDKYVALYAEHSFNGFILNNFPIIKKFKFREYLTCKILYGGLSKSNDPGLNSDLFKFPVDLQGNPITYTFGNKPYIEAGVGVSNIFKLFRLDLVKRFTYLDHPNISTIGLRISTKIDF